MEFPSLPMWTVVYSVPCMRASLLFLLLSTAAYAVEIGDTLEQVIAEKGKPKSQMSAGQNRVLNYADGTVQLKSDVVVSVKLAKTTPPEVIPKSNSAAPESDKPSGPATSEQAKKSRPPRQDLASAKNTQLTAINRVKAIINQPVRPIRRTEAMKVSVMQPGWFHDGAITPDFNKVDVRVTQELTYEKMEYVTSDLNPGVVFAGREIEFNPMTKYFYVDRSLPKKKLAASEMQEINRLYRVIGECEEDIKAQELE